MVIVAEKGRACLSQASRVRNSSTYAYVLPSRFKGIPQSVIRDIVWRAVTEKGRISSWLHYPDNGRSHEVQSAILHSLLSTSNATTTFSLSPSSFLRCLDVYPTENHIEPRTTTTYRFPTLQTHLDRPMHA